MKNFRLDPDETFLDSSNLPDFNVHHFEGRLERPIKKASFRLIWLVFVAVLLVFSGRLVELQLRRGVVFAERSRNNTLRQIPVFAERGLIKDRRGEELAWNEPDGRRYTESAGFSHLLGYISYPQAEELGSGKYHPRELIGRSGIERVDNYLLEGGRGTKIEEVNVSGEVVSEHILAEPTHGNHLELTIDGRLQERFYRAVNDLMTERGFQAGAGVILDVRNGEVLALVSAPEYDSNVLSRGDEVEKINAYLSDPREPFLFRAVSGQYTPGSIVKPVMALAALNEKLVKPEKKIFSSGALRLPNPYDPEQFSVFRDWKAHGWVDLRHAIAVSSDVYFYAIGGGFEDQPGLGISRIDRYAKLFGFGEPTGIDLDGEAAGLVPTPEWKAAVFPDDPDWRVGNTYHTVIGQYGFQATPLQVARATAAIATGGRLVAPTVVKGAAKPPTQLDDIAPENYQIVREGMRLSVTEGTAMGLSNPSVRLAGKTGTAELGSSKQEVNSWVTGFWPYEDPRYAFALVMERGPASNLVGATAAMRQVLDWLVLNAPEYLVPIDAGLGAE